MIEGVGFLFIPFLILMWLFFIVIATIIFGFWIWMLVDCAKREFKVDGEKIVWIIAIVFMSWVGALVYFIVIRMNNAKGVYKTN